MSTMFKLCFPPYWVWFVTGKPLLYGVQKICGAPKAAMVWWYNSKYWPQSYIGKAFSFSLAGFVLAPGTLPWTFYQIAKAIGYEKEAEAALGAVITAATWSWETVVFGFKVAKKAMEMALVMM